MKKLIISILLLPASCFAQTPGQPFGPPPFSNIYEKPVLSPYVFIDPNFSMPYYSRTIPLLEQEKQQREIQRQNKKIYKLQNQMQNPMRPTGQSSERYHINTNGIRPTGHPTYFMNNLQYY